LHLIQCQYFELIAEQRFSLELRFPAPRVASPIGKQPKIRRYQLHWLF
jgi:hypothetical protein